MRFDKIGILSHILTTLLAIAILCAIAVRRDGTLLGWEAKDILNKSIAAKHNTPNKSTLKELGVDCSSLVAIDENTWIAGDIAIVSTAEYGKKIYGYGGNTPLYIAIKDKVIVGIAAGENYETPSYWRDVVSAGTLTQWIGVSIDKVNTFKPDAVSGATMSCDAIHYNIKYTANAISGKEFKNPNIPSIKSIIALIVLIFGVVTSFVLKSKDWRIVKLILNIAVLGFWCGSFISISLLVNWLSNGTNIMLSVIPLTMIALAIVMPFIGKKDYYCHHVCPFGASQELVSKLPLPKIKMSSRMSKNLGHVREIITAVLLALMLIGISASHDIINYEVFSVFMFGNASWIVIALAGISLILSLFVHRPYCRFVCPTGQILHWMQSTKHKKK